MKVICSVLVARCVAGNAGQVGGEAGVRPRRCREPDVQGFRPDILQPGNVLITCSRFWWCVASECMSVRMVFFPNVVRCPGHGHSMYAQVQVPGKVA